MKGQIDGGKKNTRQIYDVEEITASVLDMHVQMDVEESPHRRGCCGIGIWGAGRGRQGRCQRRGLLSPESNSILWAVTGL
jgi:hypothetical protein